MKKFLVQVSITAESMLPFGSADVVMTINADSLLLALQKAFAAHPTAICFDAYRADGEFPHLGTYGTELPDQWAALAERVTAKELTLAFAS